MNEHLIVLFTYFVLTIFIGFEVISKVPAILRAARARGQVHDGQQHHCAIRGVCKACRLSNTCLFFRMMRSYGFTLHNNFRIEPASDSHK